MRISYIQPKMEFSWAFAFILVIILVAFARHSFAELRRFDWCWRPGAFSFYGKEGPYRCEMAHAWDVDRARWAAWLRRGAEAGFPALQQRLSLELYLGRTMPKDWSRSAFWLLKAARAGHRMAQSFAGAWYYRGVVLPRDRRLARLWRRRAADNGDPISMFVISTYYRRGVGGAVDKPLAEYFMRIARIAYRAYMSRTKRRLPEKERLFRIGIWHLCTTVAPQDVRVARRFLKAAAADGHTIAKRLLRRDLKKAATSKQCRSRDWPYLTD